MRIAAILAMLGALTLGAAGTASALPAYHMRHAPHHAPIHWKPCPDPRLQMACFTR